MNNRTAAIYQEALRELWCAASNWSRNGTVLQTLGKGRKSTSFRIMDVTGQIIKTSAVPYDPYSRDVFRRAIELLVRKGEEGARLGPEKTSSPPPGSIDEAVRPLSRQGKRPPMRATWVGAMLVHSGIAVVKQARPIVIALSVPWLRKAGLATKGRVAQGPVLSLKDSYALDSDLITVRTGKIDRRRTIEAIRTSLRSWMDNPLMEKIRAEPLDVAIVAKVNRQRMEQQDVDNIAKIVLDALKKHGEGKGKEVSLFHRDSQVVRLLVYKLPRTEHESYDTDEMTVSLRKHDPKKQMILEEVKEI